MRKYLKSCHPEITKVICPDGKGEIMRVNILTESVVVKLDDADEVSVNEYALDDIKVKVTHKKSCCKKKSKKSGALQKVSNKEDGQGKEKKLSK